MQEAVSNKKKRSYERKNERSAEQQHEQRHAKNAARPKQTFVAGKWVR